MQEWGGGAGYCQRPGAGCLEPSKKNRQGADRPARLALGAFVEYLVERLDGQAVEAVRKAL